MSDVLSSDTLESQFGPTEVEVLQQDSASRVIRTRTAHGGQVLELSRVFFKTAGADAFSDIHLEVLAGKSMGKAFRSAGVPFKRRTLAVYEAGPPPGLGARFGRPGKATVVEVSILAGSSRTPYADILEVYSPAVAWPQDGKAISRAAAKRLEAFDKLLTDLKD